MTTRNGTTPTADHAAALYCPQCGYDLRALAGAVCPECGLSVDRATLTNSLIPWTHRHRIGHARAFVRTVWVATYRSKLLAQELSRPVSFTEAQWFRWTCVAVVALPLATILLALLWFAGAAPIGAAMPVLSSVAQSGSGRLPWTYDLLLPWAAGAAWAPVMPLALVLLFTLISGVPSYWFHPRSIPVVRQNRAVAVSYYAAAAPLVFLPLPLIGWAVGVVLSASELLWNRPLNNAEFRLVSILLTVSFSVFVAMVLLMWFNLVRLVKRVTEGDVARTLVAAACFPLAYLACAALSLFAFPWAIGFVYLMFDSFR